MSKLNADRVHRIIEKCLFSDEQEMQGQTPIMAEGVLRTFAFHPQRIADHKQEIGELLAELPDEFMQTKGGGMSFLNACMDRHGNHWAEHSTIELLFVLGLATGHGRYCMPREMWRMMPGGMPYYTVLDKQQEAA